MGMKVSQNEDSIIVNLDHYIESIKVPNYDFLETGLGLEDIINEECQMNSDPW